MIFRLKGFADQRRIICIDHMTSMGMTAFAGDGKPPAAMACAAFKRVIDSVICLMVNVLPVIIVTLCAQQFYV